MDPYQREYAMQSNLQSQQIDAQMQMNAPMMLQQTQQMQAALVEQTNPSHVLEDIKLKLQGYRERYDGSYEQISEPLMNKEGIGRMLFILSSVVSQNTILSHLETHEIGRLIIQISDDIIDDLVINWRQYGIRDKMLLDHIVDVILIPSFMALKRAWKQNEKHWLGRAVVETVSNKPQMPIKKEGFFSKLRI